MWNTSSGVNSNSSNSNTNPSALLRHRSEDGEIGEEEGEIISQGGLLPPASIIMNTSNAPDTSSNYSALSSSNAHRHYPIHNSNNSNNTPEPPGRNNSNPFRGYGGGGGWRGRFRGGRGPPPPRPHSAAPPKNASSHANNSHAALRTQSYGPAGAAAAGANIPHAPLHRAVSLPRPTDPRFRGGDRSTHYAAASPVPPLAARPQDASYGPPRPNLYPPRNMMPQHAVPLIPDGAVQTTPFVEAAADAFRNTDAPVNATYNSARPPRRGSLPIEEMSDSGYRGAPSSFRPFRDPAFRSTSMGGGEGAMRPAGEPMAGSFRSHNNPTNADSNNYYGPAKVGSSSGDFPPPRRSPLGRGGGGRPGFRIGVPGQATGLPPPPLAPRRNDPPSEEFAAPGRLAPEQPFRRASIPPPLRMRDSVDIIRPKIPPRPSPHATPEDRKPPIQFLPSSPNSTAPQPPAPPTLVPPPVVPGDAAPPSRASPARTEEPPPPLLTSALGKDVTPRAEHVVQEVEHVLQVAAAVDTGSCRKLPSKQQILQALAKMDAQIKNVQKEVEEAKVKVEEAVEEENVLRQKAQEDAVAEAERQVERQRQMEMERRDVEEKAHGAEILSFMDEKKQLFESEQAKVLAELEMKLQSIKEEEEKKMREALNEQMITTADNFDRDILQMKKELEKATSIAQKTEIRLSNVEMDFRAKLEESGNEGPLEVSPKPTDLVARIIAENQRKAAEAHLNQLIFVSQDEDSDTDDASYPDLELAKDPSMERTTAEWAERTRQITGPADALYSEPCEAPYYAHNEESFQEIGPLVQEYVRHKQNKLKKHWMELAEEYEYRRTLYKTELISKTQSREKPKKSLSVPVKHSILQGGKPNQPILESGGVRSSSNPYRRARRGNEVRSEYEQEQIIAEIAAKEAMEKRITFGGSDLPRQIGQLEKELTCPFFNTFTAQRIDVLEQERELKLCNVWSDMEKAIFLDRWLQFPKDFRKIASFLRNKTTKDCVQFYYDSKQSVPYKGALREQVMRRKRRGDYNIWTSTVEAALSVGVIVEAGTSEEKPLVFFLPERDDTYFTRLFHPMQREVYDAMVIDEEVAADYDEECDENSKSGNSRKRQREPLFTLDPVQAKFLKETDPPLSVKGAIQSRSSMGLADGNLTDDGTKDDGGPTPIRRAPQKWSAHEKTVFLETLEKHGRNWSMLSQAIGTKSISQIKNYFYDYKKQVGRGRSDKKPGAIADSDDKPSSRDDANTPTNDDAGSIPPTLDIQQESDQGQISDTSFHNLQLQPGQYQSHPMLPGHGTLIHDAHYHHVGSGNVHMARALQQDNERSMPRSGTSTPDRMDLWTQARHIQNEEAARQLLLQHHSQAQQQQILSTLLPWINSGHVGTNSLQDQQIQNFLLQQQQQSSQNPYNQLAALGLSGLQGYGNSGLPGLGPQQHRHQRQSSHEAQVVFAQHLLNLHAQGNGQAAEALGLLARLPDPNRNNNGNHGGNF